MTTIKKPEAITFKQRKQTTYDFFDVLDYIHKKYKINTFDYLNVKGHMDKWKTYFFQSKKENFTFKEIETLYQKWFTTVRKYYDSETLEVNELYEQWLSENPKPEKLNFWQWLLENDFLGISNESINSIDISGWLNKLPQTDWRYKIFKLIYDEFKQDVMYFWVEW